MRSVHKQRVAREATGGHRLRIRRTGGEIAGKACSRSSEGRIKSLSHLLSRRAPSKRKSAEQKAQECGTTRPGGTTRPAGGYPRSGPRKNSYLPCAAGEAAGRKGSRGEAGALLTEANGQEAGSRREESGSRSSAAGGSCAVSSALPIPGCHGVGSALPSPNTGPGLSHPPPHQTQRLWQARLGRRKGGAAGDPKYSRGLGSPVAGPGLPGPETGYLGPPRKKKKKEAVPSVRVERGPGLKEFFFARKFPISAHISPYKPI